MIMLKNGWAYSIWNDKIASVVEFVNTFPRV